MKDRNNLDFQIIRLHFEIFYDLIYCSFSHTIIIFLLSKYFKISLMSFQNMSIAQSLFISALAMLCSLNLKF